MIFSTLAIEEETVSPSPFFEIIFWKHSTFFKVEITESQINHCQDIILNLVCSYLPFYWRADIIVVFIHYHTPWKRKPRRVTYSCLPKLFLLTQRTDEFCLSRLHLTASSVTGFEARLSSQMFGLRLQISESNKEQWRDKTHVPLLWRTTLFIPD